jgi:hypothetical protein
MFTKPIIHFNLLSFITENSHSYVTAMLSVCVSVSVQGPPFRHLNQLTNCHETWYERHGIGSDPTS